MVERHLLAAQTVPAQQVPVYWKPVDEDEVVQSAKSQITISIRPAQPHLSSKLTILREASALLICTVAGDARHRSRRPNIHAALSIRRDHDRDALSLRKRE